MLNATRNARTFRLAYIHDLYKYLITRRQAILRGRRETTERFAFIPKEKDYGKRDGKLRNPTEPTMMLVAALVAIRVSARSAGAYDDGDDHLFASRANADDSFRQSAATS